MSFGKMTEFISLQKKTVGKDADGFPEERYGEPIRIRAYKEDKNGSRKWANFAEISAASSMFQFRFIPGVEITKDYVIRYKEETYQIVSVENVRGRNRYVQVIAEREVEGNGEDVIEDAG